MADFADHDLDAVLANPQESYAVELKGWIDPQSEEGRSTIAKASIALRNNNGGLLLLGFNDDGSASEMAFRSMFATHIT